jgi:hypothetical protein
MIFALLMATNAFHELGAVSAAKIQDVGTNRRLKKQRHQSQL